MLQGLLGADAATQKAKLEEATKNANDVTSVVRKKEKAPATIPTEAGSSKRKLEVDEDADNGKRAKTEEIP
jgi:HAT1-interacting factor 1